MVSLKCFSIRYAFVAVLVFLKNGNGERWGGLLEYTTIKGQSCVTSCEKNGQTYYWCYIENNSWDYCSPDDNRDYKGNECNSACEPYGRYFTCYTDSKGNWDYCGKSSDYELKVFGQYKTINGKYCVSKCEKAGQSYSWCYAEGGSWDYCSSDPGTDFDGYECKNTCDSHGGTTYTWCNLRKGSWNYCGTASVSSEIEYTYQGSKCVSPCELKDDSEHNTCYDATRTPKYCSRMAGLASNNMKCLSSCDTKGGEEKYYMYCWTKEDKSSWSYCSNVKHDPTEPMALSRRGRNYRVYFPKIDIDLDLTRTRDLDNIYSHRDDQGNNIVTFFEQLNREATNSQYSISADADLQSWTLLCLRNWRQRGYHISSQNGIERLAIGGERNNEERRGVRLDQQSRYTRDGIQFLNLQLQVNGITRSQNGGRSTTIAEVQVPEAVAIANPNQVVDAFIRSIYEGHAVHIGRFSYDPQARNQRRPGN